MSDINRYNPQKFRGDASKTYCAAFYKHTNVRHDGNAYACCRGEKPVAKVEGDLSSLLHTNEYQNLRKKTERGIKLSGCSKCYLEEEHGKFSMRQQFNKDFGTDKEVKLELLETGANWAKNNPDRPPKEGTQALKSILKIPGTVKKIRFMGGEPFMTNTHRKLLQTMKDADLRNLRLEYTTNGQFMLTPDDHALLSRAKHVIIDVSVDAFGGLNSIVREGADWEKIDMFVDDIMENTNYNIGIYTTLHNKGWKNLDKLAKWVHSKKMKADNMRSLYWQINPLTYPEHLCISHLPSDEKEQLIKWVEEYDTMFIKSSKHYIKSILNIGK